MLNRTSFLFSGAKGGRGGQRGANGGKGGPWKGQMAGGGGGGSEGSVAVDPLPKGESHFFGGLVENPTGFQPQSRPKIRCPMAVKRRRRPPEVPRSRGPGPCRCPRRSPSRSSRRPETSRRSAAPWSSCRRLDVGSEKWGWGGVGWGGVGRGGVELGPPDLRR